MSITYIVIIGITKVSEPLEGGPVPFYFGIGEIKEVIYFGKDKNDAVCT